MLQQQIPPQSIQQSRRNVRKFVPDIFKWIIIKNRLYNLVRTVHQFRGFSDLPEVEDDAVNVLKGIKGLGARQEDI